MSAPDDPRYGERYEHALVRAAQLHSRQFRKRRANEHDAPPIPYLAHLLEVSALVWLAGGNEDAAIAGLLHDTLEDQGHQITADQIETEFGHKVVSSSKPAPTVTRINAVTPQPGNPANRNTSTTCR